MLGDSLWALRLLPALSGAATVVLVGLITRDLGGGRFAQALACLCAVLAPVWLAVDHFYSMNAFDTLFWTLAAWLLLEALDNGKPGTWMALGVVLGLGLLNKTSVLWFGGAAAVGLLVTTDRRVLWTPWPWAAAAIAAVLFAAASDLAGAQNGWPTLEFMRNATSGKMVRTGVTSVLVAAALVMNPVTAPVWLAGLAALLWSRERRVLGLVFVGVAALLCAGGSSRPNYLSRGLPAAVRRRRRGHRAGRRRPRRAWLRPVTLGSRRARGRPGRADGVGAPAGRPARRVHAARTSLRPQAQEHSGEGDLPQVFADMFGWEEMVQRVARVYHSLPADQRAKCAIFADNYGEAGAVDFFGPRYGLPPAISRAQQLLALGPARRHRRGRHHRGRQPRRPARGLWERRPRRHHEVRALHAVREWRPDLRLPGAEPAPLTALARDQELPVTRRPADGRHATASSAPRAGIPAAPAPRIRRRPPRGSGGGPRPV